MVGSRQIVEDDVISLFPSAQTPLTPRSGTITTGGTPQDLAPANTSRSGIEFQNQSTFDMYIRDKGAAGANVASAGGDSIWIPAGSYYETAIVSGNAISVFCATTSSKFFAQEW